LFVAEVGAAGRFECGFSGFSKVRPRKPALFSFSVVGEQPKASLLKIKAELKRYPGSLFIDFARRFPVF
jgi:hypothetical protein